MSNPATSAIPKRLRTENYFLSAYLILFGILNQAGQWNPTGRLNFRISDLIVVDAMIPAGAAIQPGILLVITAVGTLMRREWGYKLGCLFCLIHLTLTAVTWPMSLIDAVYVAACAVGAVESWRVLYLLRRFRTNAG